MQISGTLLYSYDLTYTSLSYGLSRLKIGIAEEFLVEVSHIEFLDNQSNGLRPHNRSELDIHVLNIWHSL
jgi:hypothetical protein